MTIKNRLTYLLVVLSFSVAIEASETQLDIVLAEDIKWGYLNPLRGDKSPGAANLWGDRTADNATGMLVRFKRGFSSPPHIHNISYRGVVIKGLLHNAHPDNETSWMPTGSYWTQPAGHNHITAANGETNLIYLEIDRGPYLVLSSLEQFNNGEQPINVHKSNMVWLHRDESTLINADKAAITHLWQKNTGTPTHGTLVKLSPDFSGQLLSGSDGLRSVVISGSVTISESRNSTEHTLQPGSYFQTSDKLDISLKTDSQTMIYMRFKERILIEG